LACRPRTLQAAQRIAAEHAVLADECIEAAADIPDVAARLVNAPSGPSGGTEPAARKHMAPSKSHLGWDKAKSVSQSIRHIPPAG
jgi:hypothetical protein